MAKLLSVSVPDELAADIEEIAAEEGKTKSELVREALTRQLWKRRWTLLQRYGREQAERLGIGPEDVEDLVDEVRREMREERSAA